MHFVATLLSKQSSQVHSVFQITQGVKQRCVCTVTGHKISSKIHDWASTAWKFDMRVNGSCSQVNGRMRA